MRAPQASLNTQQVMPVPPVLSGGGSLTSPPPRGDALPENHSYVDNGCRFHLSCLSCPLPFCAAHDRSPYEAWLLRARRLFVHRARLSCVPWPVIARYLHLSLRRTYSIAALPSAERQLSFLPPPPSLDTPHRITRRNQACMP